MYNRCFSENSFSMQLLSHTEPSDTETTRDERPGESGIQAKADWARLTEDLPSAPRLQDEALEQLTSELIGRLIQDYERIIQRGLPPAQAIASVIGWASGECRRIRP